MVHSQPCCEKPSGSILICASGGLARLLDGNEKFTSDQKVHVKVHQRPIKPKIVGIVSTKIYVPLLVLKKKTK